MDARAPPVVKVKSRTPLKLINSIHDSIRPPAAEVHPTMCSPLPMEVTTSSNFSSNFLPIYEQDAEDAARLLPLSSRPTATSPVAQGKSHIVILTKPGSSKCHRIMLELKAHGFSYMEIPLKPCDREYISLSLTGQTSLPQLFVNGRLIGGSSKIRNWLPKNS